MPVIADQERYRRVVEEESRRKRDLAGYRRVLAEEGREMREAMERTSEMGQGILAATKDRLRASVPDSTYRLWLEPLEAVGVEADTLYLTAPEGVRAWAERRYSSLIAEALADGTEFRRVAFVGASA